MKYRIYSGPGFQWHEEKMWVSTGGTQYDTPRQAMEALLSAKTSGGKPQNFECAITIKPDTN